MVPVGAPSSWSACQWRRPGRTADRCRARVRTGLKLLVVGDHRDAGDSLARMLELLGHRVERAGDGIEAAERVRTFQPDVARLDLATPNANGWDAATRLSGGAG